jgi:hypothetical protein
MMHSGTTNNIHSVAPECNGQRRSEELFFSEKNYSAVRLFPRMPLILAPRQNFGVFRRVCPESAPVR